MNPDRLRAVLFTTALLRTRRNLDYRSRAAVISSVEPFNNCARADLFNAMHTAFREAGMSWTSRGGLTDRALHDTETLAKEWMDQGVFAILRSRIRSPDAELHGISPVFFAKGDVHILDLPAAAVLNSRRPRLAHPATRWIQVTKAMINHALTRGFAIVSSYGPLPYCVASFLSKGSPTVVVCDGVLPFMQPQEDRQQFLLQYRDVFDLDRTLFLSPFPPGQMPPAPVRCAQRDHLVAALSSLVMTGDIRSGGNMASVLETVARRRVPIENAADRAPESVSDVTSARNEFGSDRRSSRIRRPSKKARYPEEVYRLGCERINRCVNAVPAVGLHAGSAGLFASEFEAPSVNEFTERRSYLVHYTRSWPGPWPGQLLADYCESLVSGLPNAGHSAFDTLMRILREGRIRASRRLNRGGFPVTCFTECLPPELQSIVEWRRGLIRWRFEPYGLAFRKEALFNMGARPVIYAVEDAFSDLSEDLKYLFQLQRGDGMQWSSEREWRVRGDVFLADFGRETLLVIVRTVAEAEIIEKEFGYRAALAGISMDGKRCGVKP